MGYQLAGFQVVGVDIEPQPHYPFEFYQYDAVEFIRSNWREFAAIHSSPVCKLYSACNVLNDRTHPDQISEVRETLVATALPYVIENVEGAPLLNPTWLCGAMFGLRTYRHRGFETNFPLPAPPHPEHIAPLRKMGRPVQSGEFIHVVGHFSGVVLAREVMGMPWATRDELAQAVPVAYTEYVGKFLMAALRERAA